MTLGHVLLLLGARWLRSFSPILFYAIPLPYLSGSSPVAPVSIIMAYVYNTQRICWACERRDAFSQKNASTSRNGRTAMMTDELRAMLLM